MGSDSEIRQMKELLYEGKGSFEKSEHLGYVTFIQFIYYKEDAYLLSGLSSFDSFWGSSNDYN